MKNVTTLPSKMEISWSKLYCFPEKSGFFPNSQFFDTQLKNFRHTYPMLYIIFSTSLWHYPPCSVGMQSIMNFLTVGCNACMWDGQHIPLASWLLHILEVYYMHITLHVLDNFYVHGVAISHWWKINPIYALRTFFIGRYECQGWFYCWIWLIQSNVVAFLKCVGQLCTG